MAEVVCTVYDLSAGLARSMSRAVTGVQIDGVWHTGIVVFGCEYFFGGGIQKLPVGEFARDYGIQPVDRVTLGTTSKSQQELHAWLETQLAQFSVQTYDIFTNNCNNFSDACAKFLLSGTGIPSHIVELPQQVLNTPIGQMLGPMYQSMQQRMQEHMIPFNGGATFASGGEGGSGAPAAAAAATPAAPAPADTPASAPADAARSAPAPAFDGPGVELSIKVMAQEKPLKVKVASLDATVADLMAAIEPVANVAQSDQRLILRGQFLKDSTKKLSDCGVAEDTVIHLVPKPSARSDSAGAGAAAPAPSTDPLDVALAKMNQAPEKARVTAFKTLHKVVSNVVDFPLEQKYRKIKRENPALVKRLGDVPGSFDCLLALGFVDRVDNGERILELEASEQAWNKVVRGKDALGRAIAQIESGARAQPAPAGAPGAGAGAPGMGGFPMFGGMPGGMPNMPDMSAFLNNPMIQQQMSAMMQNPDMMRQMLSNPEVQRMMQDPNGLGSMFNSTAMQRMMENPGQIAEMMSNPMVQQMMQQMAGSGGAPNPMFANLFGGGLGGGAPSAGGGGLGNANGGANGNAGPSDDQMTEEEMIQEAIRRSLQEQ